MLDIKVLRRIINHMDLVSLSPYFRNHHRLQKSILPGRMAARPNPWKMRNNLRRLKDLLRLSLLGQGLRHLHVPPKRQMPDLLQLLTGPKPLPLKQQTGGPPANLQPDNKSLRRQRIAMINKERIKL